MTINVEDKINVSRDLGQEIVSAFLSPRPICPVCQK